MYQKIMVPLDGSELAECVLPHVETIVKGCGVEEVIFLQVVEQFQVRSGLGGLPYSDDEVKRANVERKKSAEDYLSQIISRVKWGAVNLKSEVLTGETTEGIADYAKQHGVDLIVIATHGRSGISRWAFGSVADRLLHAACAPVLMVRAPGCVPGI